MLFPWLQGEILSLAAPCSGEQQQKNLLCLRALRCWHQPGSGAANSGCAQCLRALCRSKFWWGQHVVPGFAPLECSGDMVTTIPSHGQSRVPAPLDGLGKQILTFLH